LLAASSFSLCAEYAGSQTSSRKRAESTGDSPADEIDSDNLVIYPLAIPVLLSVCHHVVIVVNASFAGNIAGMMTGYAALIAVMVTIVIILCV
jgi:small neutral amino acid transporter SnatA (MarC family)